MACSAQALVPRAGGIEAPDHHRLRAAERETEITVQMERNFAQTDTSISTNLFGRGGSAGRTSHIFARLIEPLGDGLGDALHPGFIGMNGIQE